MPMKLYLAGPDVFFPDAVAIGAAKKDLCAARGAVGLFPLDSVLDVEFEHDPKPLVAHAIFLANRALIDEADAVLANLTPFRGPSADAGTVWECGYAFARGKKVFGYSTSATPFAARTRAFLQTAPDGLDVEDFDLPSDNLMLHFALAGYFAHDGPRGDLTSFTAALDACVWA